MSIKIKKESDGNQTLGSVISALEKQFGTGCIRKLGDDTIPKLDVIQTGSFLLDAALGVGGYPKGRIIEVYGPESSGKTTLALHAIAACQKAGEEAAFIDAEHALDITYAQNIGVDIKNLYVSQPDYGEQALEILDQLVRSSCFGIVVLDSVAALVPKAEIEGEMSDIQVGLQARLMSKALRKITASISKTNTCVIFINQTRQRINTFGHGDPSTTSGGTALKFYSSLRLEIKRIGALKDGEDSVGNKVSIKVVKNKVAPPFKKIETEIVFGRGLNQPGELLDAAGELGIVEKSGAWYTYQETRFQGRNAGVELLATNKELFDRLLADVKIAGAPVKAVAPELGDF